MRGKVLLLFSCVWEDIAGSEMTAVQFIECVSPLKAVDDALGWECLRWTTAEGGENESSLHRL